MSTQEYPACDHDSDELLGAMLRAAPRDDTDCTPTEYRRLMAAWSDTAWHPPAHGTELAVHTEDDRTVFVRPNPDGVAPSISAQTDSVPTIGVDDR